MRGRYTHPQPHVEGEIRRASRSPSASSWRMRRGVLLGEAAGLGVGAGLGPHVGDAAPRDRAARAPSRRRAAPSPRRPARCSRSLVMLDERAHHRALLLPRRDDRLVGDVHPGQLGARPSTARACCRASSSSTFTSVAAASNGGQEAREDVAAVEAGGEADARLGRGVHQRRRRRSSCTAP